MTGLVGQVTGLAQYSDREPQALIEGSDSTGRPIGEWTPTSRLEPVEG